MPYYLFTDDMAPYHRIIFSHSYSYQRATRNSPLVHCWRSLLTAFG
nr:hypothetical protein [Sodalis-like endosymbiont of Proechinophthirus fluctus]